MEQNYPMVPLKCITIHHISVMRENEYQMCFLLVTSLDGIFCI